MARSNHTSQFSVLSFLYLLHIVAGVAESLEDAMGADEVACAEDEHRWILPVPPRFFSFRSDAIRPAARCAPFRLNMTNRLCFCDGFLSQNCRFQETNPLVSFNDSIDFVQQSQWSRSTIPLILFQKTAVFISFIRHFSCIKVAFKIGSAGVLARCDYRADRTPALLLAVVFRFFLGSLRSSHLAFTSR